MVGHPLLPDAQDSRMVEINTNARQATIILFIILKCINEVLMGSKIKFEPISFIKAMLLCVNFQFYDKNRHIKQQNFIE